jgi:hypothetical protein
MKEITITFSEISAMHECRRRHDLSYIRLLKPKAPPSKLMIGSAGHEALGTYYLTKNPTLALDVYDKYIEEGVKKIKAAGQDPKKSQGSAARVRATLRHYLETKGPEDHDTYEFLEIEKDFKIPILDPVSRRRLPKAFYAGKIDAIVRHRQNKALAIWENKFLTAFDSNINILAIDLQLTLYNYGAGRLIGEFPTYSIYNVLKKPGHKITDADKKDRPIFDEVLKAHEDRVYSLIRKDEKTVQRSLVTRNMNDFRVVEEELFNAAKSRRKLGYAWRNVGPHCSWKCPFTEVCFHEDPILMDTLFEQKTKAHEELSIDEE